MYEGKSMWGDSICEKAGRQAKGVHSCVHLSSLGRQLGSRIEGPLRAERAGAGTKGPLNQRIPCSECICVSGIWTPTQGQVGNQPPYSQEVMTCQDRRLDALGGIHSQGWTTRLLSRSHTAPVCLPVACIPWWCSIVGNPTKLALPKYGSCFGTFTESFPNNSSLCASSRADGSSWCCMDTTLSGSKTTAPRANQGSGSGRLAVHRRSAWSWCCPRSWTEG